MPLTPPKGKFSGLILMPEDLTPKEIDALDKQSVCMEDWDYMIVIDPAKLVKNDEGRWSVTDYTLERLLTGCCDNVWYKVKFRGRTCGIGIAYHG